MGFFYLDGLATPTVSTRRLLCQSHQHAGVRNCATFICIVCTLQHVGTSFLEVEFSGLNILVLRHVEVQNALIQPQDLFFLPTIKTGLVQCKSEGAENRKTENCKQMNCITLSIFKRPSLLYDKISSDEW